jgi:hypothetical protein
MMGHGPSSQNAAYVHSTNREILRKLDEHDCRRRLTDEEFEEWFKDVEGCTIEQVADWLDEVMEEEKWQKDMPVRLQQLAKGYAERATNIVPLRDPSGQLVMPKFPRKEDQAALWQWEEKVGQVVQAGMGASKAVTFTDYRPEPDKDATITDYRPEPEGK